MAANHCLPLCLRFPSPLVLASSPGTASWVPPAAALGRARCRRDEPGAPRPRRDYNSQDAERPALPPGRGSRPAVASDFAEPSQRARVGVPRMAGSPGEQGECARRRGAATGWGAGSRRLPGGGDPGSPERWARARGVCGPGPRTGPRAPRARRSVPLGGAGSSCAPSRGGPRVSPPPRPCGRSGTRGTGWPGSTPGWARGAGAPLRDTGWDARGARRT